MPRVSTDDLAMAIDWLENYEGQTPEESAPFLRVAEWLKAEIKRRDDATAIREIIKQTGATPARACDALNRIRSK